MKRTVMIGLPPFSLARQLGHHPANEHQFDRKRALTYSSLIVSSTSIFIHVSSSELVAKIVTHTVHKETSLDAIRTAILQMA